MGPALILASAAGWGRVSRAQGEIWGQPWDGPLPPILLCCAGGVLPPHLAAHEQPLLLSEGMKVARLVMLRGVMVRERAWRPSTRGPVGDTGSTGPHSPGLGTAAPTGRWAPRSNLILAHPHPGPRPTHTPTLSPGPCAPPPRAPACIPHPWMKQSRPANSPAPVVCVCGGGCTGAPAGSRH